jgi:Family of unknown function (DUF6058)
MTVEFEFSGEVYAESKDWIERECIDARVLHTAVGIRADELADLKAAGIIPEPTYEIYDTGIISPVASLGISGRHLATYYGPAVVGWLRRSAVYRRHYPIERLRSALRAWLDRDFHGALIAYSDAASQFGWSHLFEAGTLVPERFASAATRLWEEWLAGGWAVCLNRFSGYDVVNKDVELERIPKLAEQSRDGSCGPELIDSMLRFDSIVRAFAPFERPMSSRCRVIDQVVLEQDLPWPSPQLSNWAELLQRREAVEGPQQMPQRADV